MSWHPEPPTQESPEVCAEKIADLEVLFANFEGTYHLESLRSITFFLTKEERRTSPRAQALIDIIPILKLVNFLEGQPAAREAHHRVLNSTIIGALKDSPDGIGEIVVHRRVNEDGTVEKE